MKRLWLAIGIVPAFGHVLIGTQQVRAEAPAFEAASIRRNIGGTTGVEGSGRILIQTAPGTLTMRNVTLMSCLRWAYDVHDYQIAGPSWLGSERYDIIAKAADPAGDGQLKVMLRTLLADRFKLGLHHESRELAVFGLTVASRTPNLKPADPAEASGAVPADGGITYKKVSMPEFAGMLSNMPTIGRPVVDTTGLQGTYNVTLIFIDPGTGAAPSELKRAALEPALFMDALERAGLRLESRKAPVDFIVVDRGERAPTDD